MNIPTTELVNLCRQYGPLLHVPPGLDGVQLLWALSGNESDFGTDCAPRHELAYCRMGKYFDKIKTEEWGCLYHCSFGPWQVMADNAIGFTPLELLNDLDHCATATIGFINRYVFGIHNAQTLEQFGQVYNGGHIGAVVPEYVAKLTKNYAIPLPE